MSCLLTTFGEKNIIECVGGWVDDARMSEFLRFLCDTIYPKSQKTVHVASKFDIHVGGYIELGNPPAQSVDHITISHASHATILYLCSGLKQGLCKL